MIDSAGSERDGENSYPIGTRCCVINLCAAIGPEDGCYSGRIVDTNGITLDGLCEFAIDILDAIHAIERCSIGGPSSAIKTIQIWCG